MLIFQSLDLEQLLTKNSFYEKMMSMYHSTKLTFDAEFAEKFLNVVYYLCMYLSYINV